MKNASEQGPLALTGPRFTHMEARFDIVLHSIGKDPMMLLKPRLLQRVVCAIIREVAKPGV
jgi:hypothetical protein